MIYNIQLQNWILNIFQTNKEIDAEMNSAEQRSVEIQAHNKAIELLADHQTSLEKLDKITSSVKKKLVALAGQWEEHRRPLMEKYRHTKAAALLREVIFFVLVLLLVAIE